MSEDAKDEWRRIIAEMVRLKLVTSLDTTMFCVYCEAVGHWKTAVEALRRMAGKDPVMRGLLIKDRDGDARQNPMLRVVRGAAETMVRLAAEFGLTPIARARIASAGFDSPGDPGKFDGLIS